MATGITLEELMGWSEEAAEFWKDHLEANPALLELPCGIGGTANVQAFIRHIWGVELRWSQRLAGTVPTAVKDMPEGPVNALFGLHTQALEILRGLMAAPDQGWEQPFTFEIEKLPPELRTLSRRKVAVHLLFHSQRHYAQLATLVRNAGFQSEFKGDLLFSSALD
jgi:uncharacterized damage-inducible protein DinB